MKKSITIIAVLLFVINSFGQENKPSKKQSQPKNIKTSVFTLDLGNPSENSLQNSDSSESLVLPSKNPLAFKIENGNPYKYRYVINSKVVSFFDDVKVNYFDSISKTKTTLVQEETLAIESTLKGGFKSYNTKAPNAFEILTKNSQLYNDISIFPILPKDKEDDKTNILNAVKVLKTNATILNADIYNYVTEISSEDFLTKDNFITKRKDFNFRYTKLLVDISNLNNDVMNFEDLKMKEEYIKNTEDFKAISSKIKQELLKMFQLKFYNYLLPVDVNGKNIDLVEVTVERYDKSAVNPTPEKYVYNIYVKGGLKIDISGGMFITSLMDKEYETSDTSVNVNGTNETQKIISDKNKGDYDFGFGSMVNISLRGGSWIRPALSIGALFTANQKFQILSGFGFILGKEERIILHIGLAMGSVAEISNKFQADGKTPYDLGTTGQVSTYDKFKFGHFFGFTYNFGKTKTQTKNN